jgi:hypothetical protein
LLSQCDVTSGQLQKGSRRIWVAGFIWKTNKNLGLLAVAIGS